MQDSFITEIHYKIPQTFQNICFTQLTPCWRTRPHTDIIVLVKCRTIHPNNYKTTHTIYIKKYPKSTLPVIVLQLITKLSSYNIQTLKILKQSSSPIPSDIATAGQQHHTYPRLRNQQITYACSNDYKH